MEVQHYDLVFKQHEVAGDDNGWTKVETAAGFGLEAYACSVFAKFKDLPRP
jgi:hypothetical protein